MSTRRKTLSSAELPVNEEVEKALELVTARLKEDKAKVSLLRSGDTLYLQFTAPLMPSDAHKEGKTKKQYKKSLQIKATVEGVRTAYSKAVEISHKLEHGFFQWIDYPSWLKADLGDTTQSLQKIGDLIALFEERYYIRRKRNRQSEATFSNYLRNLKYLLNEDDILSKEVIFQAIRETKAGSGKRFISVATLSTFCKTIGFDYDFTGLKSDYEPKSRNLPTDEEIIEAWHKIRVNKRKTGRGDSWGWMFGVIANYGLRPHELLAIDYEKSFKPPHYELYLDELITDGIKTGSRVVFPLPIDWVHQFDLTNIKNELLEKAKVHSVANDLSYRRIDRDISFPTYDLRHRYAIRGHELGFQIDDMSRWMGHEVGVHTKTYQKYMTLSTHQKIFADALIRIEQSKQFKQLEVTPLSYEHLEKQLFNAQEQIAQLQLELASLTATESI